MLNLMSEYDRHHHHHHQQQQQQAMGSRTSPSPSLSSTASSTASYMSSGGSSSGSVIFNGTMLDQSIQTNQSHLLRTSSRSNNISSNNISNNNNSSIRKVSVERKRSVTYMHTSISSSSASSSSTSFPKSACNNIAEESSSSSSHRHSISQDSTGSSSSGGGGNNYFLPRMPPDGHEFPPDYKDPGFANNQLLSRKSSASSTGSIDKPLSSSFTSSKSSNTHPFLRHEEHSLKSVRDKIALFSSSRNNNNNNNNNNNAKCCYHQSVEDVAAIRNNNNSSNGISTDTTSGYLNRAYTRSLVNVNMLKDKNKSISSADLSTGLHSSRFSNSSKKIISSTTTNSSSSNNTSSTQQGRSQSLLEIGKALVAPPRHPLPQQSYHQPKPSSSRRKVSDDDLSQARQISLDRIRPSSNNNKNNHSPKSSSPSPKRPSPTTTTTTSSRQNSTTSLLTERKTSFSSTLPPPTPTTRTSFSKDENPRVLKKNSVEAINRRNVLDSCKSSSGGKVGTVLSQQQQQLIKKTSISEFRAIEAKELIRSSMGSSSLGKPASRSSSFTIAERKKSFESTSSSTRLSSDTAHSSQDSIATLKHQSSRGSRDVLFEKFENSFNNSSSRDTIGEEEEDDLQLLVQKVINAPLPPLPRSEADGGSRVTTPTRPTIATTDNNNSNNMVPTERLLSKESSVAAAGLKENDDFSKSNFFEEKKTRSDGSRPKELNIQQQLSPLNSKSLRQLADKFELRDPSFRLGEWIDKSPVTFHIPPEVEGFAQWDSFDPSTISNNHNHNSNNNHNSSYFGTALSSQPRAAEQRKFSVPVYCNSSSNNSKLSGEVKMRENKNNNNAAPSRPSSLIETGGSEMKIFEVGLPRSGNNNNNGDNNNKNRSSSTSRGSSQVDIKVEIAAAAAKVVSEESSSSSSRRCVSVNDIRRAFEKAEQSLSSVSSSSKISSSSHHNRMSSMDSTASDESNSHTPHYYGSVSSLLSGQTNLKDHYGSISSLASSTSLISPQELQGLIDEANQSLEESGTPSHEIMVIVLHREFTTGSIGITLAGGADYESKDITVHKVIPGTLADRDGRIQKGDRVLSINGRSTKGVTHREALSILKAPRAEVVLVLSRSRSVTPAENGTFERCDSFQAAATAYSFVNMTSGGRPPKILESPLDSKSLLSDLKFVDVPRGTPLTVLLKKEGTGLGFSLEGGKDSPLGDRPLTIKKIFTGGTADKTGILRVGDEIISVNTNDCTRMSRIEAWNFMKKLSDGTATLIVRQKVALMSSESTAKTRSGGNAVGKMEQKADRTIEETKHI